MVSSQRLWIAALVLAMLAPTGCVRRRLTVRSNPPGALIYVDNQQIGTTPCAVDFTYYGTRELRLVKPGFETLTINQPIPTPWYEFPPLDFVSENLVPTKVRDDRIVMYNLTPQIIVPTQQLLDRAEGLRQETAQGLVLPVSATAPVGAVIPADAALPPPGTWGTAPATGPGYLAPPAGSAGQPMLAPGTSTPGVPFAPPPFVPTP